MLGKTKSEDQAKLRVRDLEEVLNSEKKNNESLLSKLKDLNKKHEDLKTMFIREKNYSDDLTSSYKKLHVQSKILIEEKELLSKMNQDLSIKIHISQIENGSPENFQGLNGPTISVLQKELDGSLHLLKKKNQDLINLELKVADAQFSLCKLEQKNEDFIGNSILVEKYESLLEKYQKLNAEKVQVQRLYIDSSSIITEKNIVIQEMAKKIHKIEEKMSMFNHKSQENSKANLNSVINTATSKGTNKSSPTRSKTPKGFLFE